jgi:predicted MPP superfamily phosphohydrolase
MVTTCPPDVRRTLPTILFFMLFGLVIIGTGVATAGIGEVEPNWFILIAYNGFGSLLILVCAVWCVDILWLAWLFLVVGAVQGRKGAAQNWWWKRSLGEDGDNENEAATERTNVAHGSLDATDSDSNAKSIQLDEDRRSARKRAALILIFYTWWTAWAAGNQLVCSTCSIFAVHHLTHKRLVAAYSPHTLEFSVPVPRLPPQCDGYRLAVAADLHAGSMSGEKDTEWMVQHLNALKPDAVALVGDIGDESVNDVLRQKLAPLAKLEAPDGVFYSFGNHENIINIEGESSEESEFPPSPRECFSHLGSNMKKDYRKLFRTESPFAETITTLENEHAVLTRSNTADCSIVMVGMADWSGQSAVVGYRGQVAPDFPLALRSTPGPNGTTIESDDPPSSSLPMIMMQHQPANMKTAARDGVGLQLSGHTHGGQLWPQHLLLAGFDAISGLHAFDVGSSDGPSYLFVSEGIVGWGPRLRFLCKTDFAIFTLRTRDAMNAEGLVPDTHLTVATFAMYLAVVLVPASVLACFVPTLCWAKKRIEDRRKGDDAVDGESTSTSSKEVECKNIDRV